jgi:hypothetical protein
MATKTKRASIKADPRIAGYQSPLPRVVVGTGSEISAYLQQSPARRTLAITFEDERELAATEEVYRRIGEVLPQLIRARRKEKLTRVAEALLPDVAPSRAALVQARMQAEAKAHILDSGDYVRTVDIAKLAGYSDNNPSAQPSKWKRESSIFAVEHNGADYFPLFALNPDKSYKPYPALTQILRILGGRWNSWGVAFWFAAVNGFLDGRRPQDVLAGDPESVIAAAKDAMEGLQHG